MFPNSKYSLKKQKKKEGEKKKKKLFTASNYQDTS